MDKTAGKTDRRIQRTRQALRDALLELIAERGYDNLNIQDITDRANIARTTFYLHFDDKDDLLFSSMAEIYSDLFTQATQDTEMFNITGNTTDFDHVAEFADFYKVMLSENGSMRFLVRVQRFLAQMMKTHVLEKMLPGGQTPRMPIEVMAAFLAGAQIGVMAWWVENNMPHNPTAIAEMTEVICLKGLPYAMGIEEKM